MASEGRWAKVTLQAAPRPRPQTTCSDPGEEPQLSGQAVSAAPTEEEPCQRWAPAGSALPTSPHHPSPSRWSFLFKIITGCTLWPTSHLLLGLTTSLHTSA